MRKNKNEGLTMGFLTFSLPAFRGFLRCGSQRILVPIFALGFFLVSFGALGQAPGNSNVHKFGGRCASQGEWTANALSELQNIQSIVDEIKNDQNCKGMGEDIRRTAAQIKQQIESIRTVESSVGTSSQNLMGDMMVLNDLHGSSAGLPRAANDNASPQAPRIVDAGKTLLEKSVLFAAQAAASAAKMTRVDGAGALAAAVGADLFSGQRNLTEVSRQGLASFNAIARTTANNRLCIMNNPKSGQLFSALVQTLASFAASGQSVLGNDLAQTLSQLTDTFREVKFANIIASAERHKLSSSISCLLEVASENYCSARDARLLFQNFINSQEVKVSSSNVRRSLFLADRNRSFLSPESDSRENEEFAKKNPLRGFFLLTQQMPVLTEWIMSILVAVDPQITTDATFRNNILAEILGFYTTVNTVRGVYNQLSAEIRSQTDLKTQQFAVLDLVESLTEALTGGSRMGGGSNSNFFTKTENVLFIPYKLLKLDPPALSTLEVGTYNATQNLRNALNLGQLPALNDPTALLDVIGSQLNDLILKAQRASDNYYNRFAIPDPQVVLQRAQLGVNYNVFEILDEVYSYLGDMMERIEEIDKRQSRHGSRRIVDVRIVSDILDTRQRIQNIRTSLVGLRVLSREYAEKNRVYQTKRDEARQVRNQEEREKRISQLANDYLELMVFQGRLKEKNTEFISSLFLEFNIQLSRTGFLLNRLSNFVQLDFQMMLRDQEEGSSLMKDPRFEQSLSYVVNMTAFNYISNLTGKAPGEYLSDLSLALNLSKNNLMLIERTFKDFFVGRIAELKVQSKTPQAGHQTLELDSMKRLWVDHLGAVPTERRESWAEWVADKVGGAIGMVITSIVGSDRYHAGGLSPWPAMGGGPSLWNWGTALSSDDEFESAKRMFSLYCIQALAFNDLRGVWHTCLNVKLESPFEAPQNSELKEAFEKYLNVDFKEQALRQLNENPGANASGRICALREFYRRNYSLYLTRNSTDGRSQEHQEDLEWEAEIHRKALDRAEEKRRNELEEQQRRQAATPVQREDPGKESKD